MATYPEETPSFALKFSLQSNMAFLVAAFILAVALAWALRDHRRRLLELASEEQEDRLYITILLILFTVSLTGSYFAFNKTRVDESGKLMTSNILLDEIARAYRHYQELRKSQVSSGPPYSPDLPIHMPIPPVEKLNQELQESVRYPEEEYNSLTAFAMFLLCLFSIWYFWPKPKHVIAQPRNYMDNQAAGGLGQNRASQVQGEDRRA